MALNKFRVDLTKQDEGTWMSFGGMRFLVKASDESFNNRLQKALSNARSSAIDNMSLYHKLVWQNLVLNWEDVTTSKVQAYVVSDEFNTSDEWHELDDMQFHLKRMSPEIAESINKGTIHAKARKFINQCLLGWENVKINDDDPECIPYTKQAALDIFSDPVYTDALTALINASTNTGKYMANIKDKEIKFSADNVEQYMINCDSNEITTDILTHANDNENYREELIKADVETAKKSLTGS